MMFWMVCACPQLDLFKIWLTFVEFADIKTRSKIDEISRVLAAVDDDLKFLTGADVLDDICTVSAFPEVAKLKILLMSIGGWVVEIL